MSSSGKKEAKKKDSPDSSQILYEGKTGGVRYKVYGTGSTQSKDYHAKSTLSCTDGPVAGGFCPHSQEYKEPPHVCVEQKNAGDLPKSTETWSDDHLPIDIILLTVESCDFFSCFSLLDKPFKSYKKEIGYVYFGGIGDTSDQEKLKIALMRCSKGAVTPGGSLPAVLNAVRVLRPKAAFSVGTCISLGSEKVRMGDVVISCILTAEGFRTPVSPLLSSLIQDAPNVWVAPLQNPDEMKVTVHCDGDILSQSLGEKCRCDDVFERFPGAVAIETEGKGLYAAAYELNIEWVIVKGVASYFHQSQSATSEWMYFASTMAASVVAKMLKEPTVFGEWPHYNQGVRHGTSGDHHSLRRYGDKIIKMLIQAAKLRKEQQEKAEKMLTQLAQSYEEFHDVSTDNGVGALEAFTEYIISAYEVVLIGVGRGSVIIILECIALENLERLWNDYVSGRLDEVAEGYLLTGKMKKELKLETNCLKITIHKENYLICKKALMELPSTYSEDAAQVERKKRALNEDRAGASTHTVMEQVSKDCVIALALEVGKDWRTLGIVLGLEDRVVERISQNYKTDVWERAYRILREWQEQKGSEATYEWLDKALRHQTVGRVDLAEKAEKWTSGGTRNANDEGKFPQLFKCGNISEDDLGKIANELTIQDCIWVGRLLGLEDWLLDGSKDENGDDPFVCRHSILRQWIKRTGITKATYGQLAQALLHPGLNKRKIVQKYCVVHQEEQSASSVNQVRLTEENPESSLMETDGGIRASSVNQVRLLEENPESSLMDTDEGIRVDPAVFISYNWGKEKENQKTVKHLCSKLTEAGIHCWLDIEQMGGGDNWNAKIDEGIRAAKVVICCLTEEYCKSRNGLREATLADQLKKPIIPVLFEPIGWPPQGQLGLILSEKLYIKMLPTDGTFPEEQLEQLFNQVMLKLG